jgi:hypothetical protein
VKTKQGLYRTRLDQCAYCGDNLVGTFDDGDHCCLLCFNALDAKLLNTYVCAHCPYTDDCWNYEN